AAPEIQEQRVQARDNLTLEEARARIASQLPLAEKVKVATWVIDNSRDREHLGREVDRVVAEIEAKHGPIRAPRQPKSRATTATVSGNRNGTVYEEDLDAGQKFHNGYERTKYESERLVRAAMRALPISVMRPATIVGDSQTGEIDRLDGPYYLMVLIATNASGLRLPILGRGDAPLHLVPIDYVVDAAWHVARASNAP